MQQHDHQQDAAWIREYQQGDLSALNALITKHYQNIYKSFIYRGIPRTDAEDCTQDVCLRLITALQKFKFESSFRTFLHHAIRNRTFDYYRQHPKTIDSLFTPIRIFDEETELQLLEIIASNEFDDPAQNADYQRLCVILAACIQKIKNHIQQKLVALWLDGYKRKQMAQLLAITIGNVNGNLERGKTHLRQCVKKNFCSQ